MAKYNFYALSTSLLVEEAEKYWFEIEVIDEYRMLYYISWFWQKYLVKEIDMWLNSSLWHKIANNKWNTYKVLEANFPVPKSFYFKAWDKIDYNFFTSMFPLVVKPADCNYWDWVTSNINDEKDFKNAILKAFSFSKNIIIQEHVFWDDFRILVIDNEVFAVAKRLPASIEWDWINNIENLIKIKNEETIKKFNNKKLEKRKIVIDEELLFCLKLKWYDLKTILKKNEIVALRRNANISTWWIAIDQTDIIHKDNIKLALDIAKAVNLKVVWIDVIWTDIGKPIVEQWWKIIEVNAGPWFSLHMFPHEWKSRNPIKKLLELRFSRKLS